MAAESGTGAAERRELSPRSQQQMQVGPGGGAARLGSPRLGSALLPSPLTTASLPIPPPQERTPPPPAATPPAPLPAPRRSPQLRVLLTPLPAPGRRLPQKRLLGAYDEAAEGDGKRRRAEPCDPERADGGSDGDADSDGTELGQVGAGHRDGRRTEPPALPPPRRFPRRGLPGRSRCRMGARSCRRTRGSG